MRVEDSIVVDEAPEKIFEIVKDVVNYEKFLPSYRGARVLAREGNKVTIERKAKVLGLNVRWTSLATIGEDNSIQFQQIRGPLKGMLTEWRLKPINNQTKVTITHEYHLKLPLIGEFVAKHLLYRFIISKMARGILANMKQALERGTG